MTVISPWSEGCRPRLLSLLGGLSSNAVSQLAFGMRYGFFADHNQQIVAYHYRMARHHLFKAQTYREHAKMCYGLQLPLFHEDDREADPL
jgi:hypothetical protein